MRAGYRHFASKSAQLSGSAIWGPRIDLAFPVALGPSAVLRVGVFFFATAQDGTFVTNGKPAVHRIGRISLDAYYAGFDAHPKGCFSFFKRRQLELDADGNLFGRTDGRIYESATATHISCNAFGPLRDSTLVLPRESGRCNYCVSKYPSLLHYDAPTRSVSHVSVLKEIRHSAQLPATVAHYAYEHHRARQRKSSGHAVLRSRDVRTAVPRP